MIQSGAMPRRTNSTPRIKGEASQRLADPSEGDEYIFERNKNAARNVTAATSRTNQLKIEAKESSSGTRVRYQLVKVTMTESCNAVRMR